ncbi:MAG: site-specific DNA-methyltransferase [Halobacteriota archaeon]|jgi:DNA modification methylase
MVKTDVSTTKLMWPRHFNADGSIKGAPKISLPFQVIETINESRASKETTSKQVTLYDIWEADEKLLDNGWKNKLIWGDNLLVMGSLLRTFAGKINLIYIDPPFATGADFKLRIEIGENGQEMMKDPSKIETKAYNDTWGKGFDSYLQMMYERLVLIKDLLAENGSLYVHCDWHVSHYLKCMLDEILNYDNFRNEIIWCYSGGGIPTNEYPNKHDTILWYTKGSSWTFRTQYRPYSEGTVQRGRTKVKGTNAKLRSEGTPINDWWSDIPKITSPTDPEKLYFPTQKSEALMERIINVATNPGDLVADFFCGSGTTLAAAEKLQRRWIGCDLSRWAIHITRKRLLEIQDCSPFELLNLGKYERTYWQDITYSDSGKSDEQIAILRYIAFILHLYGAVPLTGMQHIHGRRAHAMVHIGAVDAPVTIDEVNAALEECAAQSQSELHVLGWEWEMGLVGPSSERKNDSLMHETAKQKGIKLLLLQIPREVMDKQAVEKGDIQFFELAYLSANIKKDGHSVTVSLDDFVIPNSDLIPEDVRQKVSKWSDYIDYWAVDWDFQNDSFMNGWVAYRTRKKRALALTSKTHKYQSPGEYRILVKVVDVFGNDTSQEFDIEVT